MNYTAIYIDDLRRIRSAIPNLDRIRNSRILITGATGLVCSAIVDFLLALNDAADAGVTVYVAARTVEKAAQRFGDNLQRPDVRYVAYDALEEICWDFDVDYIIHGASPANPTLYAQQPVETMLANIRGLNNVLCYARERGTKRVVFVSSSEVYGRKESAEPYRDDEYGYVDILNPRACYPSVKRACETLCASYRAEYGVDSVTVRPGHIYGPTATRSDTRASSQFFYDVIDGHDIVMKSAGTQLRSYCYVLDCTSAILTAMLNGESGAAYNIGAPNSIITIRQLAERIAEAANKALVFENPSDAERAGYNLMDNSSLNAEKLIGLGWTPQFDAEEGIRHTYAILKGE